MLAQVVMSIGATTGLKPNDLIDQFYAKAGKHLWHEGTTLEKIMKTLQDVPIKDVKGQLWQLKLSMTGYKNANAMIDAVRSGQPVILVASNEGAFRNLLDYIESNPNYSKGVGTLEKFRDELNYVHNKQGSDEYHHSLLVIGYDAAEKTVIMRDIRNNYGFKGYYRLERAIFDKYWKLIRIAFSVDVDDLIKVKEDKDGQRPA